MSGKLPGGFLNSFLSFIKEGVSDMESNADTVKTPVLPKYVPEVKRVQVELPGKFDAAEDSSDSPGDKITNDQRVSEEKIRKDVKVSKGNNSTGEKGLITVYEPDSSCDVPELPPLHVNTVHGSFLNRKNLNDSQTDDNSKECLSSARDDDCTSEDTPSSLMVKESGSRKQPQASHRKRTRHTPKKDFDEEQSQESSSSSVDVHSKLERSSPVRRQSARRAKQKAEQKRLANVKKGKRLLSLYTEVSDSNDSEETLESPSAKASENEECDSDKDPAWTPIAHSSAKRSFGSDNEEEPVVKRRRGRPPSTPKFTPQKTLTVASKSTTQATTTTTMPKLSSDIPSIQKESTVLPTTATATVPKKGLEELLPLYEGPPEADSPHSFQKGDFVLERKDLTNCESFPIWKIDSGRLLQKFEPVEKNGRRLHQSMSVYSSWIDQIHYRFKAIEVVVYSAQRGKEMVEVPAKYRPKPWECLNADRIKEPFNIYVQVLVSQSLEPTFLSALYNEKDKYYMDAINAVDEVISKCLLKVKTTLNWKDEFQKSIDQLPFYEVQDLTLNGLCQATSSSNCKSEKLLRLYGCIYRRDTLFVTEELEQVDAQEYEVGKGTLESLPIYHGLQHFKMNLLKKCQVKVNEVKVDMDMEDHVVLDKCLLDQKWITDLLNSLLILVGSASA